MSYEIKIKPKASFSFGFQELVQYKELLFFFSWKDIKVRYKQAVLGIFWTILQPAAMITIFILILTKGLKLGTEGLPPELYFMAGLMIWNLFNQTVTNAAQSVITNAQIIKKIYFPRLIIPISSAITASFDFFISLCLFLIMCSYFHITGHITIAWLNLLTGLLIAYIVTVIFSFSFGTLLSAVNVQYRDIRYALPFLIQAFFFITPVMYSSNQTDNVILNTILKLNPLNFTIDIIRTNIEGTSFILPEITVLTFSIFLILYFTAIYVFRKTEAYFADIV